MEEDRPQGGRGPNKGQKGRPKGKGKSKSVGPPKGRGKKGQESDLLKGLAAIAAVDRLPLDELSSKKRNPNCALARITPPSTIAVAEYCPKASQPRSRTEASTRPSECGSRKAGLPAKVLRNK